MKTKTKRESTKKRTYHWLALALEANTTRHLHVQGIQIEVSTRRGGPRWARLESFLTNRGRGDQVVQPGSVDHRRYGTTVRDSQHTTEAKETYGVKAAAVDEVIGLAQCVPPKTNPEE